MQQPNGQFIYLNGAPVQQPVGQNVAMVPGQQQQQQFVVLAPSQTPMQVQVCFLFKHLCERKYLSKAC